MTAIVVNSEPSPTLAALQWRFVPITRLQRQAVLRVAQRYIGTTYDTSHDGSSWKDPKAAPSAFDCSTFVCRVEALGAKQLLPDASWLIDNLIEIKSPEPGDRVGYWRAASGAIRQAGNNVVWHVMIYSGSGLVIGACDVARAVVERPIEYEAALGLRQWRFHPRRTVGSKYALKLRRDRRDSLSTSWLTGTASRRC